MSQYYQCETQMFQNVTQRWKLLAVKTF